jgi:hypothetical protein
MRKKRKRTRGLMIHTGPQKSGGTSEDEVTMCDAAHARVEE